MISIIRSIFILVAFGTITLCVLFITPANVQTVVVVFEESVAGLGTGAMVTYKGIKIGEVQLIKLNGEENVEVFLRIYDSNVNLNLLSASLRLHGITGTLIIDCERNTGIVDPKYISIDSKDYLVIPTKASPIARVMRTMSGLDQNKIDNVLDNLHIITSDLKLAVTDVQTTVQLVKEMLPLVSSTIQKQSESYMGIMKNVNKIVSRTEELLEAVKEDGVMYLALNGMKDSTYELE